jgi:hypothetical protein
VSLSGFPGSRTRDQVDHDSGSIRLDRTLLTSVHDRGVGQLTPGADDRGGRIGALRQLLTVRLVRPGIDANGLLLRPGGRHARAGPARRAPAHGCPGLAASSVTCARACSKVMIRWARLLVNVSERSQV